MHIFRGSVGASQLVVLQVDEDCKEQLDHKEQLEHQEHKEYKERADKA